MSKFIEVPYGKNDVIVNVDHIVEIVKLAESKVELKLVNGTRLTVLVPYREFLELTNATPLEGKRASNTVSVTIL